MQDFSFARELSEVYLLLVHVSRAIGQAPGSGGRVEKLAAADPFDMPDPPPDWIERICK